MSARSVGSQIQLVYQVRFLTFTPDQFTQVLKSKGFGAALTQMTNPQGQIIQLPLYSKGNLIVFFVQVPQTPPPPQIQIIFQALNTVSLASAVSGGSSPNQDIVDILMGLNVVEDVISQATLTCTTRAQSKTDPTKCLTDDIKPELLDKVKKTLGSDLNVTLLRLGTAFPLQKGVELILQPLPSDPTKEFSVNVIYQTSDMREFEDFISEFGEDKIQSIIEAIVNV